MPQKPDAMDNTMWNYLNKRMQQQTPGYKNSDTTPGPVICISREVGCKGVKFAQQLASELEKQAGGKKWKLGQAPSLGMH